MSTRSLLEQFAEKHEWDTNDMLDILCDYIDNQQNEDSFEDHLLHQEDEEGQQEEDEPTSGEEADAQ